MHAKAHSLIMISWLLEPVCLSPKVIPLSDFHCINLCLSQNQIISFNISKYELATLLVNVTSNFLALIYGIISTKTKYKSLVHTVENQEGSHIFYKISWQELRVHIICAYI